jgi:hypothetical protein
VVIDLLEPVRIGERATDPVRRAGLDRGGLVEPLDLVVGQLELNCIKCVP